MLKRINKGACRFKTFSLYHYTLETGAYLVVYLQYNLIAKSFGTYQLLRFNRRPVRFKRFRHKTRMITREQEFRIIMLRGLGYTQEEIANEIGVSRKTVENKLKKLKIKAQEAMQRGNFDEFYYEQLLGEPSLLRYLLTKSSQYPKTSGKSTDNYERRKEDMYKY